MVFVDILVVGLLPRDSGKTTVSRFIAGFLRENGVAVSVFKPVSGHNWFYQYEAYLRSFECGVLFCEDIIKLRDAAGIDEPYELLNPVDFLLSPLDPFFYADRDSIGEFFIRSSIEFAQAVIGRITYVEDDKLFNTYLLNEEALHESIMRIEYIGRFLDNADKVVKPRDWREFEHILYDLTPKATSTCYNRLKSKYDVMVIESFNDAAYPCNEAFNSKYVVVVSPGRVFLYSGEDYVKVVSTLDALYRKPLRLEDVIAYLKPLETFTYEPAPPEALKDLDKLLKWFKGYLGKLVNIFLKG